MKRAYIRKKERIYVRIPVADRFWRYVQKSPDCWEWTGAKKELGYGVINTGGRNGRLERAHRMSWILHNGPIPTGSFVCHRCDNPPCVNPDHLFLGTNRANMLDCKAKGRIRGGQKAGISHSQAKLSDEQILAIRAAYIKGQTSLADVAAPYGVTPQTVWRIVHGLTRI